MEETQEPCLNVDRYIGISVSVVREWTWLTWHRESVSHMVSILGMSLKPGCRLIQGIE